MEDDTATKMRCAIELDVADDGPSPDPPGVGTRRPLVWLVADRLPPKAHSTVPLHTTAGRELVWPLIDPTKHRISNASDPAMPAANRNGTGLKLRWRMLGQPATIALGHAAAVALRWAEVPLYATVSHPQWVWRFKQHRADHYRAELAELLAGVMLDRPPRQRAVEESTEIKEIRARLEAAPGKFLVARAPLERAEAHNLTRRLRRAGLTAVMHKQRDERYAVLARAESEGWKVK